MNLASQLALSAFSQSPVVEEGLTVAKNFAENRFVLLKAFDDPDDDSETVLSHVTGENLPPVPKSLSTDYSRMPPTCFGCNLRLSIYQFNYIERT